MPPAPEAIAGQRALAPFRATYTLGSRLNPCPTTPCSPASARRRQRKASGFTIVEVMMAAVILVVGFFGMIQAVTIGSEMLATARRQALASQIITHESEKLRLLAWGSLPVAGTQSLTIDSQFSDAIAANGLSSSAITLSRTVTDIDVNSDSAADIKEVKFTIQWTKSGTTTAATPTTGSWLNQLTFFGASPISRTYTRSMVSYLSKYGINLSSQRS